MAEMIPIWRDIEIEYNTSDDYCVYEITNNGRTIYTGKAYKKPNSNYCYFKINKIIENYLEKSYNPDGGDIQNTGGVIKVELSIDNALYNSYWFVWNWDYVTEEIPSNQLVVLNRSINGKYASGGKMLATILNTYDTTKTINIGGVNRSVGANSITTFTLNDTSGDKINIGDISYDVVKNCIEYQLIYLNKIGGYDVVNLNGRTQIEDEFEGLEHVKTILNTSNYHEKNKWLNEVKRVFNGNIFWLNNEQAERLQHLYSSIQVWLYDIKNDRMIPVVIEDKSIDYQNNKKLISFNVRVSESKTKVIR